MAIVAYNRSQTAHFGSDFHMYYSSGLHFSQGKELYVNPDSGAPYVYPPFAAFLFQALNLTSEGTGAGLICFFNALLIICTCLLTASIAQKLGWKTNEAHWAVLAALLLSATDVWNNISFSQINPFIFFLTVLGIHRLVHNCTHQALALWTLGAWIKVLPVVFILWALVRKFSWKGVIIVAAVSAVCVSVPFLFRGPEMGFHDLVDYYHQFLRVNMGGVNIIWRNQSLSAALTRAFIPREELLFISVPWAKNVVESSAIWIKVICLSTLIGTLALSFYQKHRGVKISMFEIALVFLAMHLFSGITWRGHLLTTAFIFVPLFRFANLPTITRYIQIALISAIAIVFATPKGVWGSDMFSQIHLWSLPTWCLATVFIFYVVRTLQLTISGNGLNK